MTTEDKQLLLKDLSARLPYKVMIKSVGENKVIGLWDLKDVDNLPLPYLRPMSSMTDKEETLFRCELPAIAKTDAQLVAMRMELFLKGHLDFNHLIEKGLALEAPEDMYKTE